MIQIIKGQRFNLLTVIEEAEPYIRMREDGKRDIVRKVICQCDCGNTTVTKFISLRRNHTRSCGCLGLHNTDQTKHGLHKHPLNHIWAGMKQRCNNKNSEVYKRYGGRGISVCEEWGNDFMNFYNWAMNNGWKKGLQIDRTNNDGNYSPDNCRITTAKINSNNRRDNVIVVFNSKPTPLGLACESLGLNLQQVYEKIKYRGYSFGSAVKSFMK